MNQQSNAADPLLSLTSSSGPSLSDVFRVVRKRKWMIASITLAAPLLAGLVVSKQPKVYESSASIVIEASVPQYLGQSFRDVVDVEASWWTAQEMLATELRVLKSHSQAMAVAKELCNVKLPDDDKPALTRLLPGLTCTGGDYANAALLLQGLVDVAPIKDSRVVNVTVRHTHPPLTALVANTAAHVYTQRNLERRLSQSEGAATWLGDEYGDLSTQLNTAEGALIDFKKKNNILAVGLDEQQNDLSNRRKKLADELSTTQVKLIGLRAQREEYSRLQSDDPLNSVKPGVTDHPVVARLKDLYVEQYAKVVELRGRYLEKHPMLVGAESRLDSLKSDLAREAGLAGKGVEAQYMTLLKQERDLKSALDATTQQALQLEQRAIEYNRLKRNFDRLSKLSDHVGGRERETSLAQHLKTNNVRMLDAALVPGGAIAPNLPRAVALALVVGLVLAFGLAFLIELLDVTVKTQEDIEKTIKVAFLGLIPTISTDAKDPGVAPPMALAQIAEGASKDLYVLTHPKSSVAECCRSIRTNLLFMSPDHPARRILITSAGPQEGKTTSAVNLAITMAQSGLRVLLIDTDMRRPRLHKVFGIPSSEGLSKAIVSETSPFEMVRETGVNNLWLLPCGATPPNPAEILHSDRFKNIVAELEAKYDRLIFDSPPVAAVTDAAILARLTDGTVMVAKSRRTSKDSLKRAHRALIGQGGVTILGAILNDLDLTDKANYGYYYYYSHYGYYANEDEARPAKSSSAS